MINVQFSKIGNRKKDYLIKFTEMFSSTQIIMLGFLFFILIGTILLCLPIASYEETSILDAIFVSTSAICVTGLTIITTVEHWTIFGQTIILMLIQIGGLGAMTVATLMLMILNKKISFRERLIIQESINHERLGGVVRTVKKIISSTLIVEGVGAFFLSFKFIPEFGFIKGVYVSIFHAISAFCNAGFDIIGDKSLIPYVNNTLVNVVIMSLIIISGLGFSVWFNIIKIIKEKKERNITVGRCFSRFSLQTKIVLVMTSTLIIGGAVLFFIFEFSNPATIGNLNLKGKILASLFQSVSPRTAGFATVDLESMNYASKFLYIIFMFIGGSPGGTAGGMKTVTFAIIFLAIFSVIKGRNNITAFRRKISFLYLQKALTIVMMGLTIVISATMLLTFTEEFGGANYEFIDLLFEATSAIGTVGSTLSFTPNLTSVGRVIIIILMFIGRLGPMTIAMALTEKSNKSINKIEYPEENILVG